MVLSVPDTGLHLESSAKSADTLPLQAFALTLNDNVIEDLIQRVQNGGDVKLSLGNVPSLLCGKDVHKIPRAAEIPNLDLYLTDPSDSTQEAEKLPHPTMSLFMRPELRKYPKLAAGRRVVVKEKAAPANPPARSPKTDLPDDIAQLKKSMAQAKNDKLENGTKIVNTPISGVKRGAKTSKAKLLPSGKGSTFTTTISRSGAASPALSGTGSPSLGATLSADELAKERAKELRSPIVHELAVREMTFEELQSRWPNDDSDFKPALDKVADFDSSRQKYALKKMYWKELDVFRYGYDSDEERQKAIDNAIRMYDRMRVGTTEPVWQKLLPKEERGKGKCLSKLQATIAKSAATAQAKTPQIKVHDAEDSSGSRNGDGNLSGVERKTKKAGSPLPRSSSQTRQPVKKTESKLLSQKKAPTPKVSPTKAGAKTAKAKGGRILSKEIISDSDSSSEDAPMAKTVAKSKAADMEREKARERERERERAGREKEREKAEREKERARERERERDREREREREKAEREKEREREREREKARQAEKARQKEAAAAKPKPKPAAPREVIKPQVVARPAVQKRSREDHDDDSSSSSGTPLSKRVNREVKAPTAPSSKLANKRPPSDSSSQGSSRSNGNAGNSLPSKYKNTSPIKSSPLASSPPTNASDFDHTSTDESRHGRQRGRSPDRSVTVANGNINVKKRKAQADRDTIDVAMADKKRQRVSTEILDKARRFKMHYVVYQQLHRELSRASSFNKEKYEKLMEMHESLEDLKSSIYSQVPQNV